MTSEGNDQRDEQRDEQRRRAQVIATLAQQAQQAQRAQQAMRNLPELTREQPRSLKQRRRMRVNGSPQRERRHPSVRTVLLGALAALLIVVGCINVVRLVTSSHSPTPRTRATLSVSATVAHALDLPSVAQLYCPTSVAWSPDATRLAVIGSTAACMSSVPQTAVGIFAVASGKLLRRAVLDQLLAVRHLQGSSFGVTTWSPDGQTLVMPLVLTSGAAAGTSGGGRQLMGLLLMPVNGSDADVRVFVGPPRNAFDQLIWDLQTGRVASTVHNSLPPALTYKWTGDGQIVPDQPAQTRAAGNSASAAFSGTPRPASDAATFPRWQPGEMVPIPAGAHVAATTPPIGWYFSTRAALWSPDGRYVAPFVPIHTLLTPPSAPATANGSNTGSNIGSNTGSSDSGSGADAGATCPGTVFADVCAQSPAVLPDPAFAGLLKAAMAGTEPFLGPRGAAWPAVSIDWSPQGNLLAAIPPADTFPPTATLPISLVAPQTGQVLLQLAAPQIHRRDLPPANAFTGNASTVWAPTGRYLAFADWNTSQIVLWGVTTTPSA